MVSPLPNRFGARFPLRGLRTLCALVVALGLLVPGGLVLCASEDGHVAVELSGPGGCADDLDCNRLAISHDDCAGPCADVAFGNGAALGGSSQTADALTSPSNHVASVIVPRLSAAVRRALHIAAETGATVTVVARVLRSTVLLH